MHAIALKYCNVTENPYIPSYIIYHMHRTSAYTYDWVAVGVGHGIVQNEVGRFDLRGDTVGVCRGVYLVGVPSKHDVHLLVGRVSTGNKDCNLKPPKS